MTKLKEFKVILYEQTVFHFRVKADNEEQAHDVALETFNNWPWTGRARHVSEEQGGISLDIEGRPPNDRHSPPPPP